MVGILEAVAYRLRYFGNSGIFCALALYYHISAGGPVQAVEAFDQRSLAGAVAADY